MGGPRFPPGLSKPILPPLPPRSIPPPPPRSIPRPPPLAHSPPHARADASVEPSASSGLLIQAVAVGVCSGPMLLLPQLLGHHLRQRLEFCFVCEHCGCCFLGPLCQWL